MKGERCLQSWVQDFAEGDVVTHSGEVSPSLLVWRGLAYVGRHASSLRGQGEGFLFLQKAASHPDSERMAW